MGLTLTRLVSRLNERVTFPAIDPRFQFRQPSVARDVVLAGVHSTRPLYVTPYALTGLEQSPVLAAEATHFRTERDLPRELGVDLRYPLSSELSRDADGGGSVVLPDGVRLRVARSRWDVLVAALGVV